LLCALLKRGVNVDELAGFELSGGGSGIKKL
jgi:hypothetical protein